MYKLDENTYQCEVTTYQCIHNPIYTNDCSNIDPYTHLISRDMNKWGNHNSMSRFHQMYMLWIIKYEHHIFELLYIGCQDISRWGDHLSMSIVCVCTHHPIYICIIVPLILVYIWRQEYICWCGLSPYIIN